MNIAKDLGSLISGLLAPQTSSSVRRLEQGSTNRSRTTTREQEGNRETTGTTQGSDRLTLSSEAISLVIRSQEQAASATAAPAADFAAQPSELLALPYSPATTSPPRPQTEEESPATRHLVRTTYGSSDSLNATETFAPPARIDFHA